MKKLFNLLSIALIGVVVMFSAGCSDDDENTDDIEEKVVGTWFGFFNPVIPEGPGDEPCDAVFFNLDAAGNIKILSFLEGDMVAGHKGTYSFNGDQFVLNLTHDWSEYSPTFQYYLNWVESPNAVTFFFETSSDGNTLTAGPSEEQVWQIKKIELSDPDEAFIGEWEDADFEYFLTITNPASYEFIQAGDGEDYTESGLLKQFIYNDMNYFLVNITSTSEVEGSCDSYSVVGCELTEAEDAFTLSNGGEEVVLLRGNSN